MSMDRLIMSFTDEIAATLAAYDRCEFNRSTMSSAGFMFGNATYPFGVRVRMPRHVPLIGGALVRDHVRDRHAGPRLVLKHGGKWRALLFA